MRLSARVRWASAESGSGREEWVELPRVLSVTDREFLSIVVTLIRRGVPAPSSKTQPPSLSETPASIFGHAVLASQPVP